MKIKQILEDSRIFCFEIESSKLNDYLTKTQWTCYLTMACDNQIKESDIIFFFLISSLIKSWSIFSSVCVGHLTFSKNFASRDNITLAWGSSMTWN
jgi:hypothetical protein